MSWRDEITLKLPSPHEEEPRELRREILDEIEDHLECAMQRELRREDDVEAARKRVLKRFGDPAKLARRLWLDAMKGRLMNQRIMFGTNLVMLVLVLAMFVVLVVMLRQHQQFQQNMLDRIAGLAVTPAVAPVEAAAGWPRLAVHMEGHGHREITVELWGNLYHADEGTRLKESFDEGTIDFGPLLPGRHNLRLAGPNLERFQKRIILPPGEDREIHLHWPDPEPEMVTVAIEHNFREELRRHDTLLAIGLTPQFADESGDWNMGFILAVINMDGNVALLDQDAMRQFYRLEDREEQLPRRFVDIGSMSFDAHVDIDSIMRYEASLSGIYVPAKTNAHSDEPTEYHRLWLSSPILSRPFAESEDRTLTFPAGAQSNDQWLFEFTDTFQDAVLRELERVN